MPFDKQKLEPILRDEITVGRMRIMINYKKMGKEWREVLEGVVGVIK